MTTVRSFVRERWQPFLIAITAVLVAASMLIGLAVFVTGPDTNAVVNGQDDARERGECVSAYRGEWQNAVGDILLVAVRRNDPSPAQVRALAKAQRHSVAINDLCDPTQPGGVVLPEETP